MVEDKGADVIMVVEEKVLSAVPAMQRVLYLLQPEGLGIFVLLESEAALFPRVSAMVGMWPWRMKRVSKFERQLQYTDGTKRWAIAACSTKASRRNGLPLGTQFWT